MAAPMGWFQLNSLQCNFRLALSKRINHAQTKTKMEMEGEREREMQGVRECGKGGGKGGFLVAFALSGGMRRIVTHFGMKMNRF